MFEFYSNPWTKVFGTYAGAFPLLPFEPMIYETAAKGIITSVEIYSQWLDTVEYLINKNFDMGEKFVRGEEVEAGDYLNCLTDAYDNLTNNVAGSFENTPFEGAKLIDQAVRRSRERFSEDQKTAEAFLQELFDFGTQTIKLFKQGNNGNIFSDLLKGKVTLSSYEYHQLIQAYGEIFKHSMDLLRPLAVFRPEHKAMMDNTIEWAKNNAGISISLLKANCNLYQEVNKLAMEFYELIEDAFRENDSIEAFYQKWVEIAERARHNFMETSQPYDLFSEFIDKNTEFIKMARDLYQNSSVPHMANNYQSRVSRASEVPAQAA